MPMYHVVWELDIMSDSPRKAAEEALRVQRDPQSQATVFDVREFDTEDDSQQIDLSEDEEDDDGQAVCTDPRCTLPADHLPSPCVPEEANGI